jgi:hypothetical protein
MEDLVSVFIPVDAKAKFSCPKPIDWEKMSIKEKVNYFTQNMGLDAELGDGMESDLEPISPEYWAANHFELWGDQ